MVKEKYKLKTTKYSQLSFFRKVWEVSIRPNNFFKLIKEEKGIKKGFIYFLIIGVLVQGIWRVYEFVLKGNYLYPSFIAQLGTNLYLKISIFWLLSQIIGIFIIVWLVHLFVKLFKGKGSYENTFKVIVYGNTPQALLGWISPALFGIWSIVLLVKGLNVAYNFSTWRSLAALLIPTIIFVIIFWIVWFLIFL